MSTIAIDGRIISTGTGRYIRELLKNLDELDTENTYLVLVRKKDLDYYKPTNPNFKIVEADFADYSLSEQWGLNKLLRSLKPDLVHFCMPQQPLLYTRPAVTTIHDLNLLRITANDMGWLELRVKKAVFAGLLWMVAHRTKRILTPSQYTKNDLTKFAHINPNKAEVIYLSADRANAAPQPIPKYEGKQFIMYLGRAEPYKNNREIIAAHHELLKTFPNLHLLIVGAIDDNRKADMKWASDNGYTTQVDFTGFVSDEESAWLYKNTQAYVIASFMEGFGLPGLEAMAYGAPVVSSNATCLPEVYRDGAYYFDPYKPGDLVHALTEVLNDESLRKNLSVQGVKVHDSYSWRRTAEQTLAVYKQVLADAPKTD